jgi:C-terminal processing protease CtpA/Prc
MNLKNKFYFLLITFSLLNFSCSKSDDNIPADLELNNFVWKGLNAFYLWQEDIPDLQDNRFSNQIQLNNYLASFSSPENVFENLLNRPTDRFSIIVDDYIALENSFRGINTTSGMEFGLIRYKDNRTNVFGYVRYVVPNSDASDKGIVRGQLFNTVDGQRLTENNTSLLFNDNPTFTIGLADYNEGNPVANGNSINLIKTELQENPIAIAKVLTEGTEKIGYLMYNQFARNFDSELNAVFANFKAENISNLIVDLRYNPGGAVSTATYLGAMITGQYTGELYSQEIWNKKVMKTSSPERFRNNFTDEIVNFDANGNLILQESINSLGLNKVYFIVTNATASASELVINSLSSYIDVILVGKTTRGKQVGSITLYDSDNFRRSGPNLNETHSYAMQPLVLEISNKNDINYPNGIEPGSTDFTGVELGEDYGNLGILGERSDPLLNETIELITTERKSFQKFRKSLNLEEIFDSKLSYPSKDNMFIDLK